MVPRIAQRGHSFKGAGQYYLHDKQADTNGRVLWTHTLNLPTQDPEKALKWMAYTAMNASRLKKQAGVASTGRKSKAGEVYCFSLAWHPGQNPDKETVLNSALETLGLLNLHEHEAMLVAHGDTPHSHVHVICNLVHPENGKTAVPSYDRLTLSQWAENLERNDGEILCEQRVINNRERRERGQDSKLKLVKHKEKPVDIAPVIQDLYQKSDSGAAFQAALQEKGYTLAAGDRRGFVLVDEAGKIHSLSRQLKGQRAADIKTRLGGLNDLPQAAGLSLARQQAVKNKTANPPPKDSFTSARDKGNKPSLQKDFDHVKDEVEKQNPDLPPAIKPPAVSPDDHLGRLDELRAWEQKTAADKHRLKQQQDEFYKRGDLLKQIQRLKNQLQGKETFFDKMSGKRAELQAQLEALKMNLASIDTRIEEQDKAFEIKSQKDKPAETEIPPEALPDKEAELKAKREEYEQRMQEHRERQKDKGKDNDLRR
ncbi:relaxase/mobilization nuclease domain-containing protein [Oscillatoria amoena NRMC-F 0135]|nr:relaxase/mobilization nuclease domain-containing protein [Oscillatoria amoena NRMC-F 0135]